MAALEGAVRNRRERRRANLLRLAKYILMLFGVKVFAGFHSVRAHAVIRAAYQLNKNL